MPSYFWKDNKEEEGLGEEGHFGNFANMQTTLYPSLMFSLN